MTDVNEEIVKVYYEQQGYLVKMNHCYTKNKIVNERNTGGQSDIDLLIFHPVNSDKAMISVKGWQNHQVTEKNVQKKWIVKDDAKLKIDPRAVESAKKFFGSDKFRRILVLSKFEKNNKNELKKKLIEHYHYDDILDFQTIIKDLIDGNPEINIESFNDDKNYRDSEFLQTLRLLIKYYIND